MRTFIFALLAGLMMTGAANADIINILNIDPAAGTRNDGFTIDLGNNDDPNTFLFTRTSDFDGGGVDDTLAFTLTRTTFNGTGAAIAANGDVTLGAVAPATFSNDVNWYSNFGNGETLGLEVSDIAYTSGEDDGTTAVFNGFQDINRTNINDAGVEIDYLVHTGPVGSTTVSHTAGDIDLTSAGTSNVVFLTAEAGAPGIRLRDLDLQFETAAAAVPEPTSFVVLLGGLSMMVMRRRRS